MHTVGVQSVLGVSLPPDPEEKGLSAEGHSGQDRQSYYAARIGGHIQVSHGLPA